VKTAEEPEATALWSPSNLMVMIEEKFRELLTQRRIL
jgi:hypothetical protein